MSSSIAIPKRKQPVRNSVPSSPASSSSASTSRSYGGPSSVASSSGSSYAGRSSPGFAAHSKEVGGSEGQRLNDRRPSLLGSSLSKSEYTVINLGSSQGPPRLVTCVKSSQGFDWNQELFLPSYADYDSSDLERRQDPVHDIVLTDEEAAALLP